MQQAKKRRALSRMPRPKIELSEQDRQRVREAWGEYRKAQDDAERARRRLVTVLKSLQRRKVPISAIARAVGHTDMAVWKKLRRK
mgnify:CR=1 FL=1